MSEPRVRIGRERIGLWRLAAGLLIVLLLAAGCGGGGAASPSDSAAPSASGVVASIEEAVSAVVAERPDLADVPPFDPNRIGGCCWYRGEAVDDGYEVIFRVGWGDCPAGCINEHTWTYHVAADGTVELVDEGGDPVPPGGILEDGG